MDEVELPTTKTPADLFCASECESDRSSILSTAEEHALDRTATFRDEDHGGDALATMSETDEALRLVLYLRHFLKEGLRDDSVQDFPRKHEAESLEPPLQVDS